MNNRDTIIIRVTSMQIGMLMSIGKLLSSFYDIVYLCKDKWVKRIIEKSVAGSYSDIVLSDNYNFTVNYDKIIEDCIAIEKEYGETFSMIVACDRALGRGHLFNVDRYPDVRRAWWPLKIKYGHLLKQFRMHEALINKYSPIVILGEAHPKIAHLVARANNICCLSLSLVKYGIRFFWSDDEYYRSSNFVQRIKENVKKIEKSKEWNCPDYEQERLGGLINERMNYSFRKALNEAVMEIMLEIYRRIKGTAKADSYRMFAWVPSRFRKVFSYKYLLKYGKKAEQIGNKKIVYFPLHLEPEISLLAVSPELNNSMEIIAWILKSLPADAVLVVKENPFSFGVRSILYYDNLRRIPNVILAHPSVSSWDWIKTSSIVAAITGTVGTEAIYFKKPIISFGKHQVINFLPTVKYANSFDSTKQGIGELLQLKRDDQRFDISRAALYHSQMGVSFELSGADDIYESKSINIDLAKIAIGNLYKQYPNIFRVRSIK